MNRPRRDSGISSRAAPTRNPAKRTDPLVAGGEMGALMRSMDWSETPLGPVARWSESLRTTVSTCLNSRFPILVFWGPDMVMLYNDSYRPMLGNKHPSSLGRPGRQAWGEIWHIIGPMLDGVRHHGLATWSEDQALQVRRRGFLEEAYFTFSYSPVRDESGQVGGIFTVVAETTSHVLDARRFKTLQEIPARTIGTTSVRDACAKALLAIEANPADFPFALLYSLDVTGKEAHLEVQTGLVSGATLCPERIDLQHEDDRTWPLLAAARQHRALRIEHLSERFGALSLIDERPVPSSAILLPVERPGSARPVALLVVGLSPRLLPDEKYLGFLDLVAGSLAASISSAHAYELETRRAESLAELDMAKTAFFSNVSHEFRTPLTLMLGPIEDSLADREEPLPPSQRERQLLVRRNGLRLQKLVNTLLEFARIGAGRARVAYCATDLAMLTRDLVSSFDSAMAGAGLVLRVDCPPLPEPVYVDHAMWEKIVLNLLSNALKFTFQGEVRVSLRWQGDHVSLSVSDTGTGIPAQELPRIFERFHRVEGARGRSHEGTGIGLALVQEIVRLHGGRVSVQSVLGQGTSFTVCLPTGDQHVPVECREAPSSALEETALGPLPYLAEASQWQDVRTPPPSGPRVHERLYSLPAPHAGARILVADDNADMRSYLVRLLSPFWQVEEVGDGMQALEAVRDRMHDLVISDVMMPGLDGLALARALRTDEQTRMVQVILLSARAGEEATIEGLKSGADEYLVKPFSANELIARVHAQLTVSELRRQAVEQERAHTEEANRLLAESRRATQLREETLAVVSHDLRTPLTAIKMAIDLMQLWLQDDERDRKLRKQTDSIRRSITRMNRLISDLLDLASIDAGTLALDTQRRSPAELLHEAHDVFAMQAAQKGLELTLDLEDGLPALECDRERILQVLNNLLANAFQFTPAGGHVRLSARRGEEGVLFVVSDDGSGIASDALPHIFDRYWHSAAHGRESHGLGLSIAAGIVKAHGGTLDVWSSEGEGSRFSFMLPVAFAAQEADAHLGAMEHARPSRPEHASGSSRAPLGGVGDDFLTGGGEMGKLIRALDWGTTPLG
ncbi:MAG: Sensor protein, partial [Myxococcaceae bacterium]|nr:Sensor protein [Myxococcaceae bacterium]